MKQEKTIIHQLRELNQDLIEIVEATDSSSADWLQRNINALLEQYARFYPKNV